MKQIDLRSDTVTKPTPAMRAAMAAAEVGDDGYHDDPTVNELERRSAEICGKEEGIFVASGTMGNLVSIMSHTRHGDSMVVGYRTHTCLYEGAAPAAVAGVLPFTAGTAGTFTWAQAEQVIRPAVIPDISPTTLVMLENTHNAGGGIIFPQRDVVEIGERARAAGLRTHLDGARIFNAAVAQQKTVAELCAPMDSVTFCLSKGLGCPIGSMVCGTREFIARARRFREMLGGGMRQAGIVAAAGLYALDHHVERLAEDHAHARLLAEKLSDVPGLRVTPAVPETNMVFAEVEKPGHNALSVLAALAQKGVKVGIFSPTTIRAVCHIDVSREDVLAAAERFSEVMNG